jgi:hypothetical protein
MAALKNARHETFVQRIIAGDSQRTAYIAAYPNSARWKPETVDSKASVLFRNDKVQERYQELQAASAAQACLTRARKLQLLMQIAEDPCMATKDRLRAIDLDNKMCGEYTQHIDVDVGRSQKFEDILEQLAKSGGVGLSDDD